MIPTNPLCTLFCSVYNTYRCTSISTFISLCLWLWLCIYLYIFNSIYICMFMHIYTYIFIHNDCYKKAMRFFKLSILKLMTVLLPIKYTIEVYNLFNTIYILLWNLDITVKLNIIFSKNNKYNVMVIYSCLENPMDRETW